MKAITMNQTHVLTDQERKGLLVITPILIGATAYGASVAYMIMDNLFRILF